jgi:leucyl-tRNA synthetase
MADHNEHVYDPHAIESRWQQVWQQERTWEVSNEHDDQDADWSDAGVEGVHRFLGRLWRRFAFNTAMRAHLNEKEIVKEIVVPGKLVNLVVR